MGEKDLVSKAIYLNAAAKVTKVMYIVFIIIFIPSLIVGVFSNNPSWYYSLLNLAFAGVLYVVNKYQVNKIKNDFSRCEEIFATVTYLDMFRMGLGMGGPRTIGYSYEYNGQTYEGRGYIANLSNETMFFKKGKRIKVIVNVDNPNKSLISDLC